MASGYYIRMQSSLKKIRKTKFETWETRFKKSIPVSLHYVCSPWGQFVHFFSDSLYCDRFLIS